MNLNGNSGLIGYSIIGLFIIIISSAMWDFSADFSDQKSRIHGTFFNAAAWLSENLQENETALLPSTQVFWSIDDKLKNNTLDYSEVWKLTGIYLQANTTENEISEARDHLREYIQNDSKLKYVVMDWVDRHGRVYFIPRDCQGFDESLKEVEKFVFEIPSENGKSWKGGIIICEIEK